MAKPKNRVWCPDCGKPKMLFDSEKGAERFIKFNGDELTDDVSKLRVYYCTACCGYHISSHKKKNQNYNATDKLIEAYHKDCENKEKESRVETSGPENDAMDRKVNKFIKVVYDEFFVKGGHPTLLLGKYIKWNYSDQLNGPERDLLQKKVMEKRKLLKK